MRKARVSQREPASLGWSVLVTDYNWEGKAIKAIAVARADTWSEAMFLAQLLADPHEYIRAAGEAAWEAGFDGGEKDAFNHQTFNEPCIPNPYQEEDQ